MCKYHKCLTSVFMSTENVFCRPLNSENVVLGTLRSQSVPPCLPAYNMYMGGVDNTGRMRKTYGYDRKCRRYWFRIFFQFLDVSVNNAYILYRHNCVRVGSKAMPLKRVSIGTNS